MSVFCHLNNLRTEICKYPGCQSGLCWSDPVSRQTGSDQKLGRPDQTLLVSMVPGSPMSIVLCAVTTHSPPPSLQYSHLSTPLPPLQFIWLSFFYHLLSTVASPPALAPRFIRAVR